MKQLIFWPEVPAAAIAIWVLVLLAVLYLVRGRAHIAVERASRAGHRLLRLAAHACALLAAQLQTRNREVMLALQSEITRRQLEREFYRVAVAVEQDMTKFQHLERSINEHVTLLAEDFERSTQVPPSAPGWISAVDAIAKLQAENNPEAVGRVLQDIHSSVQDQQREVMREYRWAVNARHKILADLRPLWRKVSKQVGAVGRDSRDLLARAHRIDTQMAAFRELCANRAEVRVESFLARWLIALTLIAAAVVLGLLNVDLLGLALSGSFRGQSAQHVDLVSLTPIAYTLAVAAAGLLLSECLQVSRMLPMVGGLPRRTRFLLTGVALLLVMVLASGEALLLGSLAGIDLPGWPQPLSAWGMANVGVVVPLLLAVLAPALESLLATSRPVLASAAAALLTLTAVLLRLTGRVWLELGRLTHHVYDILLFVPLAIEEATAQRRAAAKARQSSHHEPTAITAKVTALDFEKVRSGTAD
jgi:hypothetical protein